MAISRKEHKVSKKVFDVVRFLKFQSIMARCLRKHDLKLINNGFDHWNNDLPVEKNTIIAFINGMELMLPDNAQLVEKDELYTISGLMCNYLWNTYKIRHRNLERAINNLAIIKQKEWIEMFILIFDSFQKEINWDLGYAQLERNSIFDIQVLTEVNEGKLLDEYVCQNGQKIQKGTQVQLGDLMKIDFKNTLLFDSDLECPQWDILIPSKRNFQYVNFLHGEKSFGNVVAIYSLMTSQISGIHRVNDRVYVRSNHFEFKIEEAIRSSEVLIGENIVINNNQSWQEDNMFKFHENAENFLFKIISTRELWSGIIGFDIYAPFYGRRKKNRERFGYYGTSIKNR